MPNSIENRKLIESFLFDELPEEERFEFEERFVADALLFDDIKALEDELIESYLRGWMDPARKSNFEQKFLTTNKRRERVEFSRAFFVKIDELGTPEVDIIATSAVPDRDSTWDKFGAFLFSPKIALTAAAAIIAAVFGSWVLYQNFAGGGIEVVKNPDPAATETPESTFTPTPKISPDEVVPDNDETDYDGNTADSNGSIENTPVNKPTPERVEPPTEKTPSIPKTTEPGRTVNPPNPVIALIPGLVRSSGTISVVRLPDRAKGATLRLKLESVDYKVYQARLTDANGNVIFQKGKLKARGSNVSLFVSAKSLKKGDYILKLYGENNAGEDESVADYQFRVN